MVVYHLQKGFREIRWESNRNIGFWVVLVEYFREQRNFWKGHPVFPGRVPLVQTHLWYQFQAFAAVYQLKELICANGKRDYRMKVTSPEFCSLREPTGLTV